MVSEKHGIANGVKQDGVLSLILFGIYMDSMIKRLTLSDPGYFRQLTIRGGGGFKSPPPPPLRSRNLLCQSSPYHTCAFYQVF